jgi:prepilin-type N-terminal cleavage/methylation domain-containing protein
MIWFSEKGLTLVELLLAIAIMGIIGSAATVLLSTCLEAYSQGNARSGLYQEGLLAMDRMTDGIRRSTYLLIPNAHNSTRDILAFSGYVNDDNDFYFGDPLFPRIDEDTGAEMSRDDVPGIVGVDDDGDGLVDENPVEHGDDDEDGASEEDPINGSDDDGDGNVDEDALHDSNNDNASGIAGMDDNGDGQVDNGDTDFDDDEDGLRNEDSLDPVVYAFDSGTNTLKVSYINDGQTIVLSDHVTAFQVNYEAPERILITLTLTSDGGEGITLTEYVCPRNTFQRTGKRVK